MKRFKTLRLLIVIGVLFAGLFVLAQSKSPLAPALIIPSISNIISTPTPSPTPKIDKPIDHYLSPQISNNASYTLIFVGDSMTESLGENFDDLRKDLKKYYPTKIFGLFNYGFGSSNILSVEDRLDHDSTYFGKTYPAILGRYFDIILLVAKLTDTLPLPVLV